VNYGPVPSSSSSLRGACPVVASYGANEMIGQGHAERLRGHLQALGVEHDVKVHDEAGHCFMTEGHHPIGRLVYLPMRLGYVHDAAVDAWERIFAFFDALLQPRSRGGTESGDGYAGTKSVAIRPVLKLTLLRDDQFAVAVRSLSQQGSNGSRGSTNETCRRRVSAAKRGPWWRGSHGLQDRV
jgi:hypothetical protein